MPFLKEGKEPLNTIISMNRTADPSSFEILAICDGEENYEHENEIRKIPNVKYFKNEEQLGPHLSTANGVYEAEAPVVLMIDGHMRFSSDNWVEKIYNIATNSPKTVWCTKSYVLTNEQEPFFLDPYKDIREVSTHYSIGSKIHFFDEKNGAMRGGGVFSLSWSSHSMTSSRDNIIDCVLGANYIGTTEWLKTIKSFDGLRGWGGCEQHISIKNWLLGGDCRGIPSVSIGHIFRKTPPYYTPSKYNLYNNLYTVYTLLPDELDITEKILKFMEEQPEFNNAMEIVEQNKNMISEHREHYMNLKVQSLKQFLSNNKIDFQHVWT